MQIMQANPSVTRNVFGEPIVPCSFDPLTGFFRDGCCKSNDDDAGAHVVCAIVTPEFLEFSIQRGNDLSTPQPQWGFPGLRAGDQWCVCALRWMEAAAAGIAPPVVLESTNAKALEMIPLEVLQRFDHRRSG